MIHEYEKEKIREIILGGDKGKYSHVFIIRDGFSDEIFPRYVSRKPKFVNSSSIRSELNAIQAYNRQWNLEAIYNYDMDIDKQLEEEESFNINTMNNRYDNIEERAYKFAYEKHKGQDRKGYDHKPYITHPIEVSKLVEKYMENDYQLEIYKVVALLHGTLEDTDATYDEIEELFGKNIADIVLELTNDKDEKDRLGKDVYLADKMSKMDDKTLILKLCDRLHNVSELIYADDEFNEKYVRETVYIINYLLLYRNLNKTHLIIINDIMKEIKKVSRKSPMLIEPRNKVLKQTLENTKMPQ